MASRTDPGAISEDAFKAWVISTAKWHKWKVHHSRPARNRRGQWSTPIEGHKGLPDLVLARDGVVLLAELKTNTASATAEQREWLAAAGPHARLWRPRDQDAVLAELSTPRNTG